MSKLTDCCQSPNYLTRDGKNGQFYVCENCNQTCNLATVSKARDELQENIADSLAPKYVDGRGVVYHQRLAKEVGELMSEVDTYVKEREATAQLQLARMYSAIGRDDLSWGQDGLPNEVLEMFPEFKSSTADIPRGKKEFMDFVVAELQAKKGSSHE